MRFGKLAAVLMACGLGFTATADQIKLANGSTIIGTVEQIFEGKVKIKTDFAGDLTIDQTKIESVKTDADVNMATATGKSQAKLSEATPVAGISALWPMGAADPTLPKPPEGRKWKYEASIDITGKTGNTEKASQGAGFKATMTGPVDRLLLYVNGVHSRENHVTTEKEFIFGADYEHRIAESSHTWYVRSEYEYDKINDLDPSITTAAGYGWYAIDKEDVKVRFRLGLTHIYKHYASDRDTDSSMGAEANYHHEIKIDEFLMLKKLGTLVTDITYTPAFEDFQDYRILHESSLSMPLGGSKFWVLKIGVTNDYHNQVAPEKERMDTTYFAKLVLTWE